MLIFRKATSVYVKIWKLSFTFLNSDFRELSLNKFDSKSSRFKIKFAANNKKNKKKREKDQIAPPPPRVK